jgi:hypothetical protein
LAAGRARAGEVDVTGNPARKSGEYRRNRAIIRARGDPCARCGIEIEYDAPRYIIGIDGVRREKPWAFDCCHIIPLALGGTEELHNLQPEHVRCSRASGGRLGLQLRYGLNGSMTSYESRW